MSELKSCPCDDEHMIVIENWQNSSWTKNSQGVAFSFEGAHGTQQLSTPLTKVNGLGTMIEAGLIRYITHILNQTSIAACNELEGRKGNMERVAIFIHSSNRYWLRTYCVPGTGWDCRSCPHGVHQRRHFHNHMERGIELRTLLKGHPWAGFYNLDKVSIRSHPWCTWSSKAAFMEPT